MDQETMQRLQPITFGTLEKYDRGSLARKLRDTLLSLYDDISRYPIRAGKPEARKIIIELTIVPEVANKKTPVETSTGQREIDVPVIVGLKTCAVIKDKRPVFQSGQVCMAVNIKNDRITDARFNPNNPSSPAQMEFEDVLDGLDDGDSAIDD